MNVPNIIFIGMSGAGKSFWARKFSSHHTLPLIVFDDLIGQSPAFTALIAHYPGQHVAEKMGHYFGMPWSPDFEKKEHEYLQIEGDIMRQHIKMRGAVFDLTGSAIYHPEEMRKIASDGIVIYLEVGEDKYAEMFQKYLHDPKPVCWRGVYQQEKSQSKEEALKACYIQLLAARAGEYRKYADVTIPYEIHKKAAGAAILGHYIQHHLPADKKDNFKF